MAVHMFETLILLLMVERCIANVKTIEFRLGDRKLRVPLNNPALVELNEDGNLEDIRFDIPDQDEINKQAYISPKQTQVSSTPLRHPLESDHRIPIQRTPEDYRHPSQPNIYKYYPAANNEYPQHRQHQPINQYPEPQFSRYPQDKQLRNQHYSAPHQHPEQYSEPIQTQPHYPNEYRNPYPPPPYDPHQESHVQNLQHGPAYYPNYGYHDPYYGSSFPRSRLQENYVSNPYLNKNIDFNRNNPNTYYPQGSNLYDTREFPQNEPRNSRIKEIGPHRDPIYSQNAPHAPPKNFNLQEKFPELQKYRHPHKTPQPLENKPQQHKTSLVPIQTPPHAAQELQKYKHALKNSQSLEDKPLLHKPSSIPNRNPPRPVQDNPRHARPHPVDNFMTLRPAPRHESAVWPIHRKSENILKSRDSIQDAVTLPRRPITMEKKPFAISKNLENMSSKIPLSTESLYTSRLPLVTNENKLPTSLVIEDRKYKAILEPTITTSTTLHPEYYSLRPDNIIANKVNGVTTYREISSTTNTPDFSLELYKTTDTPAVKEPLINDTPVTILPVQNITEKTQSHAQATKEPVLNESDAQYTTANVPTGLQETNETKSHTELSLYNQNITTESPLLNIATNFPTQDSNIKKSELTSDSSLITTIDTEAYKIKSSVLNSTMQAVTSSIQNPTTDHPVQIEMINVAPELLPTLETTTNNPETSSTLLYMVKAFEENAANKTLTNDTATIIQQIFNDQRDVSSDIQHATTDFSLLNTKTESRVSFITTNKPMQSTDIKSHQTNLSIGTYTSQIPVHTSIQNKVTESPVPDMTDTSFTSSTKQETKRSNPELEQNVTSVALEVSTIPVNTNTDRNQNTADRYSHVEYTTTRSFANVSTESSDNYITTDEIVTLSPADDTLFNIAEISSSSPRTTLSVPSSSYNTTENMKTETMKENKSEILLQSSSAQTQTFTIQNSTLTDTKDAVTKKSKTRRRPCKHRKKHGHKHSHSGHRRRRRRRTTTVLPSTILSPSLTTQDANT